MATPKMIYLSEELDAATCDAEEARDELVAARERIEQLEGTVDEMEEAHDAKVAQLANELADAHDEVTVLREQRDRSVEMAAKRRDKLSALRFAVHRFLDSKPSAIGRDHATIREALEILEKASEYNTNPTEDLRYHECTPGEAWREYDARGIYLCRVCDTCREAKLAQYRPEILSGYDQSDVDEPIEPEPEVGSW